MLNKVMLIGYLGKDADLRYTPSGVAVSNFSLATTENWKDRQGQKQSKTEWHRIVYWGKGAEAVNQYLTKGKLIYVEGQLETRPWKDRNDNKRESTEIKARTVTLMPGGGGGARRDEHNQERNGTADYQDDQRQGGNDEEPPIQSDSDEDIPF